MGAGSSAKDAEKVKKKKNKVPGDLGDTPYVHKFTTVKKLYKD